MTAHDDRFARAVRRYPARWRARYGDELSAMLEDTYRDGALPARARIDLARGALVEHGRAWRRVDPDPSTRVLDGAFVVLAAWVLLVAGGSAFAKFAEHWKAATPGGARTVPTVAYGTVAGAAALGAVLVLVAAALVLPTVVRAFRQGAWAVVRRPVLRAGGFTGGALLATAGLVVWAHRLDRAARTGGSIGYGVAFLGWGLVVLGALVAGVAAAVACVRAARPSVAVVRAEGILAVGLTVAMATAVAGVVAWWVAMAAGASWFLAGHPHGAPGTVLPPVLLVAAATMLGAAALAVLGSVRAVSGLRSPRV